jgi:hypothetical protein
VGEQLLGETVYDFRRDCSREELDGRCSVGDENMMQLWDEHVYLLDV